MRPLFDAPADRYGASNDGPEIGALLLTLLVIDDSALNRRVLSAPLRAAGRLVLEAEGVISGSALDAASAVAAILDLDLGDGSGIELALVLRSFAPALPIAFFTAGGDAEMISRAKALGLVFSKPRELDAVLAWALSQG